LNEPILVQYGIFLKNILLNNDWGTSISVSPGVPVFSVMALRIPISMQINIASLLFALPIGLLLGISAALLQNRIPDYIISFVVVLFISVPSFVFAALMQFYLAFRFSWFPIIYQPTASFTGYAHSLVLPVIALMLSPIATITRYLRGELIESLSSEYMLLARTKGLTKFEATVKHAFRNAFLPLANIILPMFAWVLGGSLVVERVFGIPGVGSLMVDAITTRDHTMAVAVLIFYSAVYLVTILLVDISYVIIDPRVRLGRSRE